MNKSVIIMGGGVAGMSAAHELVERGFKVTVFEKQKEIPGGKARSVPVPGSATDGRLPLPGEHGFRFFPGFYKHVTDTMKRIPYQNPLTGQFNKQGVFDNLVNCPKMMLARFGQIPLVMYDHFPRSLEDLRKMLKMSYSDSGLTDAEKALVGLKVWQLMTSCADRRLNEYEHVGWWEFTDAENQSENYRTLFVQGLTRTLVAARAKDASTKTGGDIFLQLLFGMLNPEERTDRVLCGPTNEVWLSPWLNYLKEKGVDYQFGCEVVELPCKGNGLSGVCVLKSDGTKELCSADYYICALPVERAASLISEEILTLDPCLQGIKTLAPSVAWMNGIQFYLKKELNIVQGHIILADSPWALTAISQLQFWNGFDVTKYGNGEVKAVISVDISDWDTPGIIPYKLPDGSTLYKTAKECTKEEVFNDIWTQMKRSFNVDDKILLADEDVYMIHLDGDIQFGPEYEKEEERQKALTLNASVNIAKFGSNIVKGNEEPLLVNKTYTWDLRPEPYTDLPNLFFAADYIQTYTDLATMEGANEAARRAVNCIIDKCDAKVPKCKIWKLHEPDFLLYYKMLDNARYDQGLPWKYDKPFFVGFLSWIYKIVSKIIK